jgi:hypothetical protein
MGLEWLSLPSVVNRCSMMGLTETSKRLEVFWTAYRYLRTATKSLFSKSLDLKNPDFIMIVSNLENYRKSRSPAIYQSQFSTLKTESSATSASDSPLHEGLYKGGLGVFKIRNSKFANSKFICSFSFFLEQFESGLTGLQHNLHQDLLARQLPVDHH